MTNNMRLYVLQRVKRHTCREVERPLPFVTVYGIYSGFRLMWTPVNVGSRLMWTPVNVGSRLMWTFHQERNRLYITCTKLLRLIWANIRLLWTTQCQARVTTIGFTHVVHVYKFIMNVT